MTNDSRLTQPAKTIRASFSTRIDAERGPRARVLVSGVHAKDLDLTGNITGAIAHALWQARGGDAATNWSEAERLLEQLAGVPVRAVTAQESAPASPTHSARGSGGGVVVSSRRRVSR